MGSEGPGALQTVAACVLAGQGKDSKGNGLIWWDLPSAASTQTYEQHNTPKDHER